MTKKIKDVTLKEFHEICKTHKPCIESHCPLTGYCIYSEDEKFNWDMEVEL